MLNKTKMVKKGGIRFSENEEVNIPVFGEQEIEIPEYLAEKTAKGYQLIPTLTKSGAITKRHKEPSIKLTAKNIEYFSIPKNGVERLQLSDFVKKSKTELVKQYEAYIDFQNKLLAVELKNVLKIPVVKKMVAEADDKAEAIEEIKEVLSKEIFGDIPEPKVKKTVSKSEIPVEKLRKYLVDELNTKALKKKVVNRLSQESRTRKFVESALKKSQPYKVVNKDVLQSEIVDELKTKFSKKPINRTLGGYDEKIRNLNQIMEVIVNKERPMMFKRAEKLYHSGKIDDRTMRNVQTFVMTNSSISYENRFPLTIRGDSYQFEKEGIISKATINKYNKLATERQKLIYDLKAKMDKLAERRKK